jgi:hypothetical protein
VWGSERLTYDEGNRTVTTDLRDELHALAERRPAAVAPPDLWRRGMRRRRRVRTAAAGVVVAAVVLGALGTSVGWEALRTSPPAPAGALADGAIPDRLETPSPWLDGTEEEPPGRLAVIMGAERRTGWRGEVVNGWVGVSAGTGEYRFLDLPGGVDVGVEDIFGSEADPALSPDGRTVAYWLAHPENPEWVGGWAVYDTVSGDVLRHRVPSRLGIAPETLEWTGPGQVLVAHGVVTERKGSSTGWSGMPTVLWSPRTDETTEVDGLQPLLVDSVWPTGSGFATLRGRKVALRLPPEGRAERVVRVRTNGDVVGGTVGPDGTRVAFLPHRADLSVRQLMVGQVPPTADGAEVVGTEPLPLGIDVHQVVGWKDSEHVLVRGALLGTQNPYAGIYAVDVRTGAHDLLVRETRVSWIGSPDYADELWSRATVTRPGPDRAYDPRWVAGAGVLLAGGVALLVGWRRRARR